MKQERKLTRQIPLSELARPESLDHFVGQDKVTGQDSVLSCLINSNNIPSMILYGPPGCGKTTFAKILSENKDYYFIGLSAVTVGVADVKKSIESARQLKKNLNKRTILFLDEIHRFNKAQQDILLPHIENGTIILIGATTENPSFSLNNALLSRTKVIVFEKLKYDEISLILSNAYKKYFYELEISDEEISKVIDIISHNTDGDARKALDTFQGLINYLISNEKIELSEEVISKALGNKVHSYDKNGEYHYDLISAFIKSMRASQVDAALYWMKRMLDSGEDPLFITRRMVIFASEDIGLADWQALQMALSADQAIQRIGMPEGLYPLVHACAYLSLAPKSRKCAEAISLLNKVNNKGSSEVPFHLRNAVTPLMKEWGYGKVAEGEEKHYLPQEIKDNKFWP